MRARERLCRSARYMFAVSVVPRTVFAESFGISSPGCASANGRCRPHETLYSLGELVRWATVDSQNFLAAAAERFPVGLHMHIRSSARR